MCASLNSENFDPSPREGIPKDKIKNEIQLCFSKLDRIELGSSLKQDGKWANTAAAAGAGKTPQSGGCR